MGYTTRPVPGQISIDTQCERLCHNGRVNEGVDDVIRDPQADTEWLPTPKRLSAVSTKNLCRRICVP